MKNLRIVSLFFFAIMFSGCEFLDVYYPGIKDARDDIRNSTTIKSLKFIGEQVIPDDELFDGEVIGGLSSIDYADGTYYIISDAASAPIRFYTANLTFDNTSFSEVEILSQVELLTPEGTSFGDGQADPEAIRFDAVNNSLVWTSEGFVDDRGVDPFVREASLSGEYLRDLKVPELFLASSEENQGPRINGSFEGLSNSTQGDGYWVAMELPLQQDGPAPVFGMDTESPVRIAYIDRESGTFGKQFAYELDPVVRAGGFTLNGVVEVLEYSNFRFLVLERSFSTGYADGGNNVKIYEVNLGKATDVSEVSALEGENYRSVKKRLLFDFESIRSELSTVSEGGENIVDNIEGMTFGPDLPNGNRSLVLVADNNFSAFGPQLTQFIVLEVMEF